MGRKRVYTVTEISRKPTLFQKALPFDVTLNGEIIATVSRPTGVWRECENCGENTKNIIEFYDNTGQKWKKIILCDKCSNELI